MKLSQLLLIPVALAGVSAGAAAQVRIQTAPGAFAYVIGDPDRPMIGVSTRNSGKRDTLGLLVESVTRGGPAEKAGIEEGDRLVAVNNVNLKLSAMDAGEPDMEGIANRRLVRELEKLKAGDEVELRVYRDGSTRTVRVKTVAADELNREVFGTVTSAARLRVGNRAVLGISLGGNGSMRDTLGVLVVGVANEGPAAKAGIDEGDRLAAINGVDLRVAREDAGDWQASSARIRRLNREMEKVNAGDAVELRVYSNGQVKTVRVEAAKASDVKGDGLFFGGTGELMEKIRVMPSGSGRSTFSYSPGVAISIPAVTAPKLEVERRLRATDAALAKVRVQSQAKLRQKLEATTGMTRKARRTILL